MQTRITTLMLLLVVLVAGALAQTETGQISGTVMDPTGAVVPKATVTLKNPQTGLSRQTVTGTAGAYVFTNLLPGNYQLTATASGFNTTSQPADVAVGGRVGVDFHLTVGKA